MLNSSFYLPSAEEANRLSLEQFDLMVERDFQNELSSFKRIIHSAINKGITHCVIDCAYNKNNNINNLKIYLERKGYKVNLQECEHKERKMTNLKVNAFTSDIKTLEIIWSNK